jgi:flavorubredoxin
MVHQTDRSGPHAYNRPVEIASGVFWVGFFDPNSGLHCNPYLIVEGDEAIVIDGGSRPEFATVMMKILQTGIAPSSIKALIYQHYDPDLCASLPNFEDLIDRSDLVTISDQENNIFIRHYSVTSQLLSLEAVDFRFVFSSGRTLRFIPTPYAHSPGSFATFDSTSGVLCTSDLFGSYGRQWDLYLQLGPECRQCLSYERCPKRRPLCPLPDILAFHMKLMPSRAALRHALEQLSRVPFSLLAPQHGSVIRDPEDIILLFERLATLDNVGIERITGNRDVFEIDLNHLRARSEKAESGGIVNDRSDR